MEVVILLVFLSDMFLLMKRNIVPYNRGIIALLWKFKVWRDFETRATTSLNTVDLHATHFVIVFFLFFASTWWTWHLSILNDISYLSDQIDIVCTFSYFFLPLWEPKYTNLFAVSKFSNEIIESNFDVVDVDYV